MKRNYKSINEEINRIKSLFTEERMFGNLVEGGIREGVIKTGSKPDVVKPLQRLLKVEDDGIFGPKTKEALMKFQSDNGLEDDGIAGEETVKVLNKKFKINESNYSVISEETQEDLKMVNVAVADVTDPDVTDPDVTDPDVTDPDEIDATTEPPVKKIGKKEYKRVPKDEVAAIVASKNDNINYWVKDTYEGKEYMYRKKYYDIIEDLDAAEEENPDIQQKKITILNDELEPVEVYVPHNIDVDVETIMSNLKDDLESGKSTLKETFKLCKEQLTDMSKISSKGVSLEQYKKENDDPEETYKFCVGKFHSQLNRWDKLRGNKSSINALRKRWFSDINTEDIKSEGGTLGQKYNIMYRRRKLGVVMKKGRDEYRIRTKMGEDIVEQKNGKAEFKDAERRKAVEKAISMPVDKMIVLNKKLISREDRIWASFTLQDKV